jgi:hypothetical protein
MATDLQEWLAVCAAHLVVQHASGPRCGAEDVLSEEMSMQLAQALSEEPDYRKLMPDQAAIRFMQECA